MDTTPIVEEQGQNLSLNAMNNSSAMGIMAFTRSINIHSVKILLDMGSDDNFMQPQIAQLLQLGIQPTNPFKVLVGN